MIQYAKSSNYYYIYKSCKWVAQWSVVEFKLEITSLGLAGSTVLSLCPLSKTLYPLLSTGSTQEDASDIIEKMLTGINTKHQI